MNSLQLTIGLATLLGGLGMWLMLPRVHRFGRPLGAVLGAISLGLYVSQLPRIGDWLDQGVFWVLAAITVAAAAATVTFRNPVYCAIWFALSLLGTAGLFLFQGAQFLGVATIVVYAGAILVTFLFVLMLANPSGHARYDRVGWEPMLAAFTGALMVGILSINVALVFQKSGVYELENPTVTTDRLTTNILADQHMAHLGGELFSRHLIAVEIAGTLLLVALVGCVAIIARMKDISGAPAQGHAGNRPHGGHPT
jgi:NADH-quinone oxidoreductase subunit J